MSYPEHDKLAMVKNNSQVIGEFVDWLFNEQGVSFAKYSPTPNTPDKLYVLHDSIADWLFAYFDISKSTIEAEKHEMLAALNA